MMFFYPKIFSYVLHVNLMCWTILKMAGLSVIHAGRYTGSEMEFMISNPDPVLLLSVTRFVTIMLQSKILVRGSSFGS